MLSDLQQKRVWEGMLGAEIRSDYFADLTGVYTSRQKFSTLLILLFSSGAAASFLAALPEEMSIIRPGLAVITAAISLYSVVMQNQKLAFEASDLHFRWGRLASEYKRLWENMYDDSALRSLNALDDKATELSKSGNTLPNKKRTMIRWTNHVIAEHQGRL